MRAVSMIASILLLFSLGKYTAIGASASSPALSASSAVLYEPESETFLFSRDADTRRPMASTTKIMTALVAIEKTPRLDTVVTIPQSVVGVEGSSLYLRAGERLTMEDLLYGLMLQSANDAAAAIAYAVAGSIPDFADLMNRRAEEMGLSNTHFMNPHGLDDPEHYTTARELALIAAEAMKNETFRKIVSTTKKTIPAADSSGVRVLINHNKLLRLSDDAVGIKTGFTKKSGRCLVGAAEKNGLLLITVTLNAPDDWNDHKTLFAHGFNSFETRVLAEAGDIRYTVAVVNGTSGQVTCTNSERITAFVPKGAPEAVKRVRLSHFTGAPVKSGEVLGTVEYLVNGRVVASSSLVAEGSVEEIKYRKGLFS